METIVTYNSQEQKMMTLINRNSCHKKFLGTKVILQVPLFIAKGAA